MYINIIQINIYINAAPITIHIVNVLVIKIIRGKELRQSGQGILFRHNGKSIIIRTAVITIFLSQEKISDTRIGIVIFLFLGYHRNKSIPFTENRDMPPLGASSLERVFTFLVRMTAAIGRIQNANPRIGPSVFFTAFLPFLNAPAFRFYFVVQVFRHPGLIPDSNGFIFLTVTFINERSLFEFNLVRSCLEDRLTRRRPVRCRRTTF